MLLPMHAKAVDRTWDAGAGTTNWETAANWSADTIPTSNDNVIIDTLPGAVLTGTRASAQLRVGYVAGSSGALTISGGQLTSTSGVLGDVDTSAGTVTITGAGSNWTNNGRLTIGNAGQGTLTIEDGGVVSNTEGRIGGAADSTGDVTVSGAGSNWTSSTTLYVGYSGSGSLSISDGGTVNSVSWGILGNNATATATAIVSDTGSTWTTGTAFDVGLYGDGALRVEGGGAVSSTYSYVGRYAGATGTVTVSGLGSEWTSSNALSIGIYGDGSLQVEDGGTVSTDAVLYVGRYAGATGAVTVSDSGSSLASDGDMYLGNGGGAALTVADDGQISVGTGTTYTYIYADSSIESRTSSSTIYLAYASGSVGTLGIGGGAGDAAGSAGHVDAAQVVFGAGAGTLVFNHTNTDYEFAAALVGNGTVEFLAGETILTGDISAFTGQFTGSAGLRFTPGVTTEITTDQSAFAGTTTITDNSTLAVNGALGGTTIVANGGVLKGNGTLGNLTVDTNGTAAPGNSIGITNAVNVTFNPGSTYEVELNAAGQSDLILATGTATLNGGTVEAIPFPDYSLGSAYTILTAAGGVTGTFDDSTFTTTFLEAVLSYDANNVYVTLTPNSTAADAAARTPNQQAVAAVTSAEAGSLSFATPLYTSADADTFRAGLDSLSGEIHASMAGAFITEQQRLRAITLNDAHLRDASFTRGDTTFWAQGFGSFGSTSGTANTARMTNENAGTLFGAEGRHDDRRSGIAIGGSRSHAQQDGRSSKAASDNVHLLAYTGNVGGVSKTQHTVGASLSLHSIDMSRAITANGFTDTSKADYSGRTAEAFAEIAHPLAAGGRATLTPYLQGAVTVQQQDGFTESGAAGLMAGTRTTRVASTALGLRYDRPFEVGGSRTLHASAGAAWQHLYGDDTPDSVMGFTAAPASRFSIEGAPLARDAALLSASLSTNARADLAFSLGYDGSLATDATAHTVTARGNYSF